MFFVHSKFAYFHKLYRNGWETAYAVYTLGLGNHFVHSIDSCASYSRAICCDSPLVGRFAEIVWSASSERMASMKADTKARFMCIHATQRRRNTIEGLSLSLWRTKSPSIEWNNCFAFTRIFCALNEHRKCDDKKDGKLHLSLRRRNSWVCGTFSIYCYRSVGRHRNDNLSLKNVLQFTRRPTQFI